MQHPGPLTLLVSLALLTGASDAPAPTDRAGSDNARAGARRISFEQRLQAQASIERVYHSHRIGAKRGFEAAVPPSLVERKVRTYLAESVALEKIWKSPITTDALRRELERIAVNTRFPDRLREIYEALGNDSFLVQETFVRASLADRLARGYFSGAPPGGTRQDWETWWAGAERDFDSALVREVAGDLARLPVPVPRGAETATADASCVVQDLWGAGEDDALPAPRSGHTAVWTGSEMIVWGGAGAGTGDLDTGARYDPLTDTWSPTRHDGSPSARAHHVAVWTGKEMIVWGGDLPGTTLVTGGRYDPASNAWTATSLLSAPSKRNAPTAVWTGKEMIVWGGWDTGGTVLDTGARYDPATDVWTATSLLGAPTLGFYHAAIWTGSAMIVWGGGFTSSGGVYDPATDTWKGTSLLNAPTPRELPGAVWTGTEMVVWGGFAGGYSPGGGRYDPVTDTWRPTNPAGAPANRYYHTTVWTGGRMIVWGGTDFSGPAPNYPVNTGASYDPAADSWTPTTLAGAPAARSGHTAVWTGDRMIVWGATSDSSGGRYDPSTDRWTPTSTATSTPSPRAGHTAVWTGSEMIVWGGTLDRTGGRYDPLVDTWTPTALTGAPSARFDHTAIWTEREMIVWGGGDSAGSLRTGGRYDPVSDSWSATSTANAPSARSDHTAVWTGRTMVVWGGSGDNSGGRYDPVLDAWSPTSTLNAPTPRSYHTGVWTGRVMIVWGGYAFGSPGTLGTGGRYDPVQDVWSPTSLAGAPAPRAYHTAVWTGREMIVWGGYGAELFNTGGRYDALADAWTPTSTTAAPFGRSQQTAVWTGREMIVWGGIYDASGYSYSTNTGGRYDPAADSWSPTTTVGAPDGRELHTAVWTGTAMIVRGGEYDSGDVIQLVRDLRVAWYGAPAAAPSPDTDQDGFSVCAGDCDDAEASIYPGAPQICGDRLNNDCSDPAWPTLVGTNEGDDDGDGLSECAGDCDDTNGAAWGTPAEVAGLEVQGADPALLSWGAVTGGGVLVRYDTLRSGVAGDFLSGATCIESDDGSDTTASDAVPPAAGRIFFYLIRAENACPSPAGMGPLGFASSGSPRQGRACP